MKIEKKFVVKEKENLSLCLTKYHAMKTSPVINISPRYEDVWESQSIPPRVPNIDARRS
jgi:hypothetical protein